MHIISKVKMTHTDIQSNFNHSIGGHYVHCTSFKQIEKITATATQPQRTVLKYFALFNNVAHSLEPGETPEAPNYVQRS